MTAILIAPAAARPQAHAVASAFEHVTPNWFTSVMGTGIVATAAASLPAQFPDSAASPPQCGRWLRCGSSP